MARLDDIVCQIQITNILVECCKTCPFFPILQRIVQVILQIYFIIIYRTLLVSRCFVVFPVYFYSKNSHTITELITIVCWNLVFLYPYSVTLLFWKFQVVIVSKVHISLMFLLSLVLPFVGTRVEIRRNFRMIENRSKFIH